MNASKQLKQKYIEFFKKYEHKEIKSASLIPENDASVLFTTAGMHPLVPFLLGQNHALGKRLVNCQKCIRTGDIDEVGNETHFTFFEMLGNWSLGDYFKELAIKMSFEFLTKELNFSIKKLAVSCFEGDETAEKDQETANIWLSLGIPKERIAFLSKKENWWGPAGQTGPCGPDTEMFYWNSDEEPPKEFDPDNQNWVEIWNDVFMQYNKTKDNEFIPLQQKNVDTGMGLERVAMILEKKSNVYEISTIQPIVEKVKELTKINNPNKEQLKSIRIITDHIRASTFILGDNKAITPSNIDQGYVLRKLIRRIIRHLRLLNPEIYDKIITIELSKVVINNFSENYPELETNKEFIFSELRKEEEKFKRTLENGLRQFEKISENKKEINAKEAFLLYQSYGFPLEMIQELAKEKNIIVDETGFNSEFDKHQEISRIGAEKKFKGGLSDDSEKTIKLHTATHILNSALRKILSEDIKQRGSNITSERLRFDFNFSRKLSPEEIKKIEDYVNEIINKSLPITKEKMKLGDAFKSGAQAEFGAKYPDDVWVYTIKDFSKEICNGPHVENTKELGIFKIKKEESSAAGIRRIKAILIDKQ
jgi:alanyl-tRNA synthetase